MKNIIEKTNQTTVKNNATFNAFVKVSLRETELKEVKGGGVTEDVVIF